MARMSRVLIVALLAGCVGQYGVSGRPAEGSGAEAGVVRTFADGFGRQSPGRVLRLFADDAVLELAGLGVVLQGRQQLQGFLEYGAEVKARLEVRELSGQGDTVVCRLSERNEWFELLGAGEVTYQARFRVRQGKISSGVVALEPDSKDRLQQRLVKFVQWLKENDPAVIAKLMPGGKLRFSRESARLLLVELRVWHGFS